MRVNWRTVDFVSEKESDLKDLLVYTPDNIKDIVFICTQLIRNNKCFDDFKRYSSIVTSSDDERNITSLIKSSVIQTLDPKYFLFIMQEISPLKYTFKSLILQNAFKNTCTSMREEMFDIFLEHVHDVSFEKNIVYFLLRNNLNKFLHKISIRPEVIHTGFENNHWELISGINKDEFYDEHPEFLL